MAHAAELELSIGDFQAVADRTPYLVNLTSSGCYMSLMEELPVHRAEGILSPFKYFHAHTDLIEGVQLTVTGCTLAENVADTAELGFGPPQDVVHPLVDAINAQATLQS